MMEVLKSGGCLIVDSMTSVIRGSLPMTQQSFPARSSLYAMWFSKLYEMLDDAEQGWIMVLHHACHDEKTKTIVKGKGIVTPDKVERGDYVLGMNDKNEVIWTKVLSTYYSMYKGKMIELRGKSSVQVVTPNHRVMVIPKRYRPSKKKLIDDGRYILAENIVKTGLNVPKASQVGCEVDVKKYPLEWLIGLYIAEGNHYCKDNREYIRFSIHSKEVEYVENMLDVIGIQYNTWIKNNSAYISIWKTNIGPLKEYVDLIPNGASNKCIPDKIKEYWDHNRLEALVQGYLFGDGHRFYKNDWMWSTISLRLVSDLIEIGTMLQVDYDPNIL
jgi:hypothetical protein